MGTSRRLRRTALLCAAAVVIGGLTADPASAAPNNNTSKKLRAAVSAAGITEHLEKFQAIADANGGTRASGTPGYDASADYAREVFEAAGLVVTEQVFDFARFTELSPTILEETAPTPRPLENIVMEYSGSGDVAAAVSQPVDAGRLGCAAADFAGFPAGNIALISRGACPFALKATNAAAAGAIGVVIYNNVAGDLNGTLGSTFTLDLPVTGITQALGQELRAIAGLTLHLVTDTLRETVTTSNVIAETRYGNQNNVVMIGAHLDSVAEGPGINDNGTGSATLLEIAEQMNKVKPKSKVRFALWGAEEANLVGSTFYVNSLSEDDAAKIALYLNFDMIGSPNYVRFVYDGDGSATPVAGPEGSAAIEQLFHDYFASQGLATSETAFDGRSDYGPFIAVGIPAGGLFTGAEGTKTAAEAAIYGGTAGAPYDSCYHQACDTITNVNPQALEEMADATAHALITFAFDTRAVNGKTGHGGHGNPSSHVGHGNRAA